MNRAALALAGATVAVSFSAIFIGLAQDDPATIVWLRMALATAMLAPFAFRQALRTPPGAAPESSAAVVVAAGMLLGGHFLFWTASLGLTTVAASVLLVSLHPVAVAPVARLLLGEPVPRRVVLGIALALAGTALTCGGDFRISSRALAGDGLALLGAICLAGYLLISRRVRGRLGVATYSAVVYGVVALAAVITAAASHTVHMPGGRTALACLALAAVCTIGGHTVYNWALRHVLTIGVSLSFLGEPPLAAVLALVILGSVPPWTTVAGGVLILAGLGVTLPAAPAAALEERAG